ncbi:hypothetical protein UFOVP449_112 [uncultured Caudovirales phage]|uniref:Uncharacterized protein n=1 Tax=uncultured Caudovirales phage TaxID=2100421 RepID=A0A6J5MBF0_9CAUD|nr:hypothetical protein UFOVP449_112 [uncultured Caudovirales phage]
MPKFISDRDVRFFKGIAREVVDDVVQNTCVLYKVNLVDTRINLYGEAIGKTWHPGVELYVLINKEAQASSYEGFGADRTQTVEFRFDRFACEEKNTYPEIGDVIYFDGSYYEIDNTSEVQYSGGLPTNNFSIVCSTVMVSKSMLNIEERIQ